MSQPIPEVYLTFQQKYPEIFTAYNALGATIHSESSLNERERALVKLGMAVGAQHEGALHAHVRKALDAGIEPEEIRQVVLLAIPSVGFPAMMAAMTWVEDILSVDRSD